MELSVVTITFNDPNGLQNTLDSLNCLTGRNDWELVLVDGSPDKNETVLRRFKHLPLKEYPQKAQGIYSALNHGVEKAKGKYIWFLNGGDRLFSQSTLEEMLDFLRINPKIELLAAEVRRLKDGRYRYTVRPKPNLLLCILGDTVGISHQGILYKNEIFAKVGLYNTSYKIAGDCEHLWRCYLAKVNFAVMEKILADFDTAGTSGNLWRDSFKEHHKIHKELRSFIPWYINFGNLFLRRVYFSRVLILKLLQGSIFSGKLEKIWLAWKRLRD